MSNLSFVDDHRLAESQSVISDSFRWGNKEPTPLSDKNDSSSFYLTTVDDEVVANTSDVPQQYHGSFNRSTPTQDQLLKKISQTEPELNSQVSSNASGFHTSEEAVKNVSSSMSLSVAQEEEKPTIQPPQRDPSEFDPITMHDSLMDFYDVPSDNTSHLWDDPQSRLPEWMKRYLRWHAYTKSHLILSNQTVITNGNETIKLFVMQCLERDTQCGGLSDRLKPLPLMLRVAYYTKRLILIYWSRPGRLEEFLVPPKGGLDWTVPEWMVPIIEDRRSGPLAIREAGIRDKARSNKFLIRSRWQNYHGGMQPYDAQLVEGEADFVTIFHDLWRVAFTPSPPVRALLESDMRALGLVPGQYVGAHLRALYAVKERDERITRNWARNAINCASEIRPGKKIFFASDSDNATLFAKEYAAEHNATVLTRTPTVNPPLHMDKATDWQNRSISDFYDSFIDIYIMAQGDCLTYNKGGFGLLGLFISRNSSCGLRQDALTQREVKNPCIWVDDSQSGTNVTRIHLPPHPVASNATIYGEPMSPMIDKEALHRFDIVSS